MNPSVTLERNDRVAVTLWCESEKRHRIWTAVITDVSMGRVKVKYDPHPDIYAYEANLVIGSQPIVKIRMPHPQPPKSHSLTLTRS